MGLLEKGGPPQTMRQPGHLRHGAMPMGTGTVSGLGQRNRERPRLLIMPRAEPGFRGIPPLELVVPIRTRVPECPPALLAASLAASEGGVGSWDQAGRRGPQRCLWGRSGLSVPPRLVHGMVGKVHDGPAKIAVHRGGGRHPQHAVLRGRCSAISGQFHRKMCIRFAYGRHCINKKRLAVIRRKSFHIKHVRETGFEPEPLSGLDPKSPKRW